MSWHPNDLVSDTDLEAYERTVMTQFGKTEWQVKRQKAIEDWLFPNLANMGLDPYRLRTRYKPSQAFGYTNSVYTDYTERAGSTTADDIPLASILAASTDALIIGSPWQFRGVSIRMLEAVSSVAAVLTVESWRDQWMTFPAATVSDGTVAVAGKPFSKGGAITWTVPEDWVVRPVNSSAPLYYARLRLSAAPTGAAIGQVSVIRRSAMCAAVAFRTLTYIFREAPTSQEGPWKERADWYEQEAKDAWERVIPLIGREFDTTVDDVIDPTEATQSTAQASGGGWVLERA